MRLAALINGCWEMVQALASWISYDNTSSGLAATDLQAAVDELAANTGDLCVGGVSANYVFLPGDCVGGGDANGN